MTDDQHDSNTHLRSKPRRRKRWGWIVAGVFFVGIIAALAAGPLMSRVEEPEYTTTQSEGAIEVRAYGPMIAAEAEVKGERKEAIREGFGLIAKYIFGKNAPRETIAMTAPVQQQPQQTIAMTAPVIQQATGTAWTVRFIMPKTWTMETLPAPSDARVKLKPIPAKRFAVIRFSGSGSDSLIAEKTEELRRFVTKRKLATVSEPVLAFYNPPWTLPIFRRNEIMLELAQSEPSR